MWLLCGVGGASDGERANKGAEEKALKGASPTAQSLSLAFSARLGPHKLPSRLSWRLASHFPGHLFCFPLNSLFARPPAPLLLPSLPLPYPSQSPSLSAGPSHLAFLVTVRCINPLFLAYPHRGRGKPCGCGGAQDKTSPSSCRWLRALKQLPVLFPAISWLGSLAAAPGCRRSPPRRLRWSWEPR